MTPLTFATGSAVVSVAPLGRHHREAVLAAAGRPEVLGLPGAPDVVLTELNPRDLSEKGRRPVTRGVELLDDGSVLFASVGGSGYRQRWRTVGDTVYVDSSWQPSAKEAAAARALPARFRALRGQVLLHYPVLWWACLQGRAPLHVSVVEVEGTVAVLAGPGGLGKTTLVTRELAAGAGATCDNLAVADGIRLHGLREPLRVPTDVGSTAPGARAAHGRREQAWHHAVPVLQPDLVVVVTRAERGAGLRPMDPEAAHRHLVAGTLAAGELMRFWPLAATHALATGTGPVSVPVAEAARTLVTSLPTYELTLCSPGDPPLRERLRQLVDSARSEVS